MSESAPSTELSEDQTISYKNSTYGYVPGDGFYYQIVSIQGRSTFRRLGLEFMSDPWKEYILAHYESKKPARRPRYCPMPPALKGVIQNRRNYYSESQMRAFEAVDSQAARELIERSHR